MRERVPLDATRPRQVGIQPPTSRSPWPPIPPPALLPPSPPRPPDGALPARPRDAARRHELELPGLGRGHDLRRSWQGRPGLGHRRQRVHRPADGLRPGHPRPRRRARRRLRQRADAPRRQLLAHERGRGPGDGAGQGADRLGRQGPDDGVGHRGDDARDARRPGLHRPRQDREVRGPVPRRPRLRPDQRHARRHGRARRRRQPGRAGLGPGHPGAPSPTRSSRPATTTSTLLRRLFERAGRGDRRDHRRAGPRQRPGDHAQAGLPPGDAGADRGVRDPADLRRGQDRLPASPGRRRRVLRDHAGPRHLRQGDGQRLPGGGLRRPRGGHERPARQGQPRRHVRRQPGRRGGRGQDARDPARHGRARDDPRRSGGGSRPASREILNPTGLPYALHRPPVDVRDHVHRRRSRPSTATGRTPTTSCTTRSRSGCTPAARCPSPTRASRGSSARRTPRATSSTGSSSIFEDSLDAALEDARTGGRRAQAAAARWRTRAPDERTRRDGPRRQRRPLGRSGGGAPARPRREPGRGRRDRAGAPARASTSRRRRASWPRSRSAAWSSRTTRPASTGSGSSSSASPSGPSGRSTCAASPCPSWSGSPG